MLLLRLDVGMGYRPAGHDVRMDANGARRLDLKYPDARLSWVSGHGL